MRIWNTIDRDVRTGRCVRPRIPYAGTGPQGPRQPDPCRMAHIDDVFQDVTEGTNDGYQEGAGCVPAPSLNGSELQKTLRQ